MPVTININNLTLCHKGSNGTSCADVPDMCLAPGPTLVPYPNIARSCDLAAGTTTVAADGGNMCANFGSQFSKSTGDEGGSLGGMCSGTIMREAAWLTYSFDTKIEGKPACRLTDKMLHNHGNTVNSIGELQKHLPLSSHTCTEWHAEWAEGPLDVVEELDITWPMGPEVMGDTLVTIHHVYIQFSFRGTVKCTCHDCGSVKLQTFESPSYGGHFGVGQKWAPDWKWLAKLARAAPTIAAQTAMKSLQALVLGIKAVHATEKAVAIAELLKEHGETLLSSFTMAIGAGKSLLAASASAICSGTFDVGKLQELLDKLPKPPPPGNMA